VSDNRTKFDETALRAIEELLLQIGPRVARLRDESGWLQTELSRRTEIQPARISRIERGKVKPRLDELIRLSRAFLMPLDELVFGTARTDETGDESLLRALLSTASPEDLQAFRRFFHIFLIGFRQAGLADSQGD